MAAPATVCFVCEYAGERCDLPELSGAVLAQEAEVQGATLLLRRANGSEARLTLRAPWHRLVSDLERHGLRFAQADRPINLAAYHLSGDEAAGWTAGAHSLVVLEPDWLEDVTSLTRTHYCERQYLLDRVQEDGGNAATVRGGIVHAVFRQIVASPADNQVLRTALERALRDQAVSLAALGMDPAETRDAVVEPLRRLVRWARAEAPSGEAQSETFLLAHRLGLRGRIDAAWRAPKDGRVQTVAELKTGATWNGRSRAEHELQVGAYGLMLAERGEIDPRSDPLLLLYASNLDAQGQADIQRHVPFQARTFANLVHFRNRLVTIDLTGQATYQGLNRCRPCRLKTACHQLTELLEEPRCASGCVLGADCAGGERFDEGERAFYRRWTRLLDREWRALNDATARLWHSDPGARCADGTAATVLEHTAAGEAGPRGERFYRLQLGNDCEVRQGDRVLLSAAAGPVAGRVAQAEVLEPSGEALTVITNEALRFQPRWLDQYGSDRLFLRGYAGLASWMSEPAARRALVIERRAPRFSATRSGCNREASRAPLNDRQREALELALAAEEYLLIQGPPGTGKTQLVAAISGALVARCERVLLLAGTNRALDRLLEACARHGLEEACVRLGRRGEPGTPAERRQIDRLLPEDVGLEETVESARQLLFERPVLAATIAQLSSGLYQALRGSFGTVIVDEASQVTLPAALGALVYGRRFILVGDHRQLPAVVQSGPDGEGTSLGRSLFELLAEAREADGAPGLVRLEEQYRMNAEICGFPSRAWYEGRLRPAASVAGGRLALSTAASDEAAKLLEPGQPLALLQVPHGGSAAPRSNRAEAELAVKLVEAALAAGVAAEEIAVIAPFRAQVALIRSLLAGSELEAARRQAAALADTVDRFQGSERSLVIYSCATDGPTLHPLLVDERRLNVALTRARHKLIVLGDWTVLRQHPRFAGLEAYRRGLGAGGD